MKNIVLIRSNPVRPYPRLEKMANCLAKNGYGVTVLAWDRSSNYPPKEETLQLKDTSVTIVRVGLKGQFSGGMKKNLKGLLQFQTFIYTWLKKHRAEYDVIHAYDFDTGYTALKCAKLFRKKFVYDIPDYYIASHHLTGTKLGKIIQKLENSIINKADVTIICTEQRKEQIAGTTPKKLVVVHNTPDVEIDSLDEKAESTRLKLVYVGIFGRTRFLDKIVETVAAREDCELHIGGFGAGMEPYFEEMAKQHDNILYYGRIPYDQTIALEQNCDVMCAIYDPAVPNHYYAAPNKFYEALLLGKPLIMARNTGMASVVEEYGLGEVIDYNVESLNQAIDRLVLNRNQLTEIQHRANNLYNSKYSWNSMEQIIKAFYCQL